MEIVRNSIVPGLDQKRKYIIENELRNRNIKCSFVNDDMLIIGKRTFKVIESFLEAPSRQEYEEELSAEETRTELLEKAIKCGFIPNKNIDDVSNRSLQSFIRFNDKLTLNAKLAYVPKEVPLKKTTTTLSEVIIRESLLNFLFKRHDISPA